MSQPISWEKQLGQLGAFLAAQDAHHVKIVERGSYLAVAWQTAGASLHERSFIETDLADLWPATQSDWIGSSSPSALLGPLGREIDREQLDVACIAEEEGGFVVSGSSGGRYTNEFYSYAALRDGGAQPPDPGKVARASGAKQVFVAPAKDNAPLRHRLHLTR